MKIAEYLRRLFRKPRDRAPWIVYHRCGTVTVDTSHPAWIAHVEKVSRRLSEPQDAVQEGEK